MSSDLQIMENVMIGYSSQMSQRRWTSAVCMTLYVGFRNTTTFIHVEAGRYLFGGGLQVSGTSTVIS